MGFRIYTMDGNYPGSTYVSKQYITVLLYIASNISLISWLPVYIHCSCRQPHSSVLYCTVCHHCNVFGQVCRGGGGETTL